MRAARYHTPLAHENEELGLLTFEGAGLFRARGTLFSHMHRAAPLILKMRKHGHEPDEALPETKRARLDLERAAGDRHQRGTPAAMRLTARGYCRRQGSDCETVGADACGGPAGDVALRSIRI